MRRFPRPRATAPKTLVASRKHASGIWEWARPSEQCTPLVLTAQPARGVNETRARRAASTTAEWQAAGRGEWPPVGVGRSLRELAARRGSHMPSVAPAGDSPQSHGGHRAT